MYVERLTVTNMRVIDTAALHFQPGFNLVVGVNGVGKTTILDALSCALSYVVRDLNALRAGASEPSPADIRFGAAGLTVECTVSYAGSAYTYLVHEPRPGAAVAREGEGKPREQTHEVASRREFLGARPGPIGDDPADGRPLAVLFTTRRAAAVRTEARGKRAVGGTAAAFADALEDRELLLGAFADWMRAQEALRDERPESGRVLDAFEAATRRFLPGYFNLRVETDEQGTHRLLIDHGLAEVVKLEELTDGDRAKVHAAIANVENWLALSWTGAHLGADASPEALDADRSAARRTRIEEEFARSVPTCRNLQPSADGAPDVRIERLPTTIPVTQLSDGERGTLALVLDLTRRLAQANPHLADPAAQAEAVVLIDEIDLHLHPKWQREVVHSLTAAFPRCQFIATTHSPLVISEATRDRVQILTAQGVYSPGHSHGIDSSRVLEEVMDVSSRPKAFQDQLTHISELARPETLGEASAALDALAGMLELGDSDPDVTRLRTLLEFLEDG